MSIPSDKTASGLDHFGATATDWQHFAETLGLRADLLPYVADPTAKPSEHSSVKQPGKVPSKFNARGEMTGILRWTSLRASADGIAKWAAEPRFGICLQTRTLRALDIDIADPAAAQRVLDLVSVMCSLPKRMRSNSGKCLLAFSMPGSFPKRTIKTAHGVIEFLGTGQQFLACGRHPSGVRYEWAGGLPPEIPGLTPDEFEMLWSALVSSFALPDGENRERGAQALPKPRRAEDARDDRAAYLGEQGYALDFRRDGAVDILCPFADGHTPGTGGQTSTTYFPAGVGGFAQGHYVCKHASCAKRTEGDFDEAIGYGAHEFQHVDTVDDADQAKTLERNAKREAAFLPREVVGFDGVIELVESPTASDDALALDFAAAEQHRLRNALGLGWMVNVGTHWQRDDGLHRMDAARALCRAAANLSQKVPERKALASAKTVAAVVRLAESDRRLLVPPSVWDADSFALNTPGGVVDLRTGVLRQRTTDDLMTRCTRVAPDFAAAGAPVWCRFLDGVTCGDRDLSEFIERMLGYMLTGDRREQKLFFVHGPGANGKSVLGELVLWLIGTYGLKIGGDVLMSAKHERHPTELAQLRGVRTAISSELEEGAFFNEPRVKELTGDDTLSARFMRGDFFEFAQTHKHLIIGNHKPRLRGGDPAMARRMVLIPFRAVFAGPTLDPDMPARLRLEAPAILARLVRGAADWHAGGLGIPAAVSDASAEYMAAHDDVQTWIDERCECAPDLVGAARALYVDFAAWKLSRGERAPSEVTWSDRLQLISGVKHFRSNGAKYRGLTLRSGSAAGDFA